ncbi:MAG: hypothetical protein LUE98_04635 [Tannerellaceae bacterium]|nr:hypothetical protein [Tannerellaceae bacterium]
MEQKSFLERLVIHFFDDEKDLEKIFAKHEVKRILRMRDLHNERMKNPLRSDSERVKWLMAHHQIGERQAHYDLADLRVITGATRINKEDLRYEIIQGLRKKISENEENPDVYAKLVAQLIKVARLEKDEAEPIDYDRIYPAPIVPTSDVSVLGLPPADEGLREKLRIKYGKYKKEYDPPQDTDYEILPPADPISDTPLKIDRTHGN